MIRKLRAMYENGLLRPLEPINLPEHECVTLSLDDAESARVGELDSREVDQPLSPPESPATEARPWRGVFQTNGLKVPIFSQEIDVQTSALPSWEPQITLNRRWIVNDE